MKIAIVVPGGVDPSGTHRVIPAILWLIERLASSDEVHVYTLGAESGLERWPLLGAVVHNCTRRPRRLRTVLRMLTEHWRGRFDVVHAFWAGGPGVAAAMFRRLCGVPAVLTLPGGDLCAFRDIDYGAMLTMRGRFWVQLALQGADRIVAPSRAIQRQAAGLGFPTELVPFGVALDRWHPRAPVPRNQACPLRLVHVASLNRIKDQDTLLHALRELLEIGVDFRLDIVGQDTLGGSVQERCRSLGFDRRVKFHGFKPQAETQRIVRRADLMVVSSRHESGPIVVLEAAVLGIPSVGTAVGQIADWAPEAAVAVPVGDAAALAGAIARIAADEGERLRLARAAMSWALENDADAYVARMRGLYVGLSGDQAIFGKGKSRSGADTTRSDSA